ncbi:MAG: hypothetical protein EOP34_03020 [Rickettsiales bacterium]|nr:MAG: hypothetical protein EOP34_03020 [Rickettsiales bacterium]
MEDDNANTEYKKKILVISGEMNIGGFIAGILDRLCTYSLKSDQNFCDWTKIIAVGGGVWPGMILAGSKVGEEQKIQTDSFSTQNASRVGEKKNITCVKEILKYWISERHYDFTTELCSFIPPFYNDKALQKKLIKVKFNKLSNNNRTFIASYIRKSVFIEKDVEDVQNLVIFNNNSDEETLKKGLLANMSIFGPSARVELDPIILPPESISEYEYNHSEITFIILNYEMIDPMTTHLSSIRNANILEHIKKCKNPRVISAFTSINPLHFNSNVRRQLISLGTWAATKYIDNYYPHISKLLDLEVLHKEHDVITVL